VTNLQIKNFPDALHRALAERARSQGKTMSAYATDELRRGLERPSAADWVARLRDQLPVEGLPEVDAAATLDRVRAEYAAAMLDQVRVEPADDAAPASIRRP
jgi:plasmid stability protein